MEIIEGAEYYFTIYDTFRAEPCLYILDIKVTEPREDENYNFKINNLIFYHGSEEKRNEYSHNITYVLFPDDDKFLTSNLQQAYRNAFILLFKGYR